MKTIVITGSTRGIGLGLVDSFLNLGCAVAVSGREQAIVEKVAVSGMLEQGHGGIYYKMLGRFLSAPFSKRDVFGSPKP